MNDMIAGLLVAALTAAVVAAIFLWAARAKRERVEVLRSLCTQRSWKYLHDSVPLHRTNDERTWLN